MSSDVMMRAVIANGAGEPDVLTVGEIERPRPAADQVLIKVVAAGVNRADVMQRRGFYPPPPGEPETIGLEVSGHIAEVGADVTQWSPGQECVALLAGGGYAEYVAVNAAQIVPPPPGVDLVTAAGLVEVSCTVVSNLRIANLSAGETFLVHGGAGGIGSFAIQYAKHLDARVITTASSPDKLEFCRTLGADLAVSYREDWVRAVLDFGGTDVILDNQGARYLAMNVDVLNKDGRLVIIGLMGGRKAELDLGKLLNKRGAVMATSLRSRPVAQKAEVIDAVRDTVWPLLESGQIRTVPTKVFDLDDVVAAHEYFDSGNHQGKLVLRVS
ncbi:NAD(P)H-quinone oxidoreductase [Granulicoccus phenolivorans]|uniref:NAD(P)H-quinone oxidoreductase n=1 Tax=Granulicoccus phenolivorans TaxID=266854 RepID=UPI00042736DA|nr:NAD(P)H-quinone oxidoreductase [Granulicoccus phenolivorans]